MNRPSCCTAAKLLATSLAIFASAGSAAAIALNKNDRQIDIQEESLVQVTADTVNSTLSLNATIDIEEESVEQVNASTFNATFSINATEIISPSLAPTSKPSATPSSSPSAQPTSSPSFSPTLSRAPSSAPIAYSRPTRVDIRYVPWIDLPADIATTATLLNYTRETWNDYGENPIENLNWDRLTRTQKMYAGILGYDRMSWDCWQNHYQSLRWIDLDNEGIQSKQWWEALGWDISSWNRYDDPPLSNDNYWYFLSEEERFAAAQLCYFKRSWDEADVYVDGFPMNKPTYRYTNWFDLDDGVRNIASDGLKYDSFSWNVVGLHPVEALDWKDLTPVEQNSAELLDFSQVSWGCWVNHYRGYR